MAFVPVMGSAEIRARRSLMLAPPTSEATSLRTASVVTNCARCWTNRVVDASPTTPGIRTLLSLGVLSDRVAVALAGGRVRKPPTPLSAVTRTTIVRASQRCCDRDASTPGVAFSWGATALLLTINAAGARRAAGRAQRNARFRRTAERRHLGTS